MAYGTGLNAPRGLLPSGYLNGTSWTGQHNSYRILSGLATSIFTGDPVISDGSGGITVATSGTNPILGVFVGVKYTDTSGTFQNLPNWTASTTTLGGLDAEAMVVDDPNVLFDVQVAQSGGPNAAPSVAATDLLKNAILNNAAGTYNAIAGVTPAANPAAGANLNGQSNWYLDYGTAPAAGNATRQVKIQRFTPVPGNIAGVIFNNVQVSLNNEFNKGGTGTAGI